MKLGAFAVLFGDLSLESALDKMVERGLETVEIGCGGHPGKSHCDPARLLEDSMTIREFKQVVNSRGLEISALSCHGNPLHPNSQMAKQYHDDFENAVLLAEQLEVENIITFSGCPGESDHSLHPVWVTCPWPEEYTEVLEWQWREKVIPYWQEQNHFVESHGVRVAIEPHPGFVVYNTETALRLRAQCGDRIGVNFDPSHFFWQQMDPALGIKEIAKAGALYHIHAKDTEIDPYNTGLNGVLDTKSYRDELARSWIFRTVGYGHGEQEWRRILSTLQLVGYNGAISIEHEDSLMSVEEGFKKAVAFLKQNIISERLGDMWWT